MKANFNDFIKILSKFTKINILLVKPYEKYMKINYF